jgi:hypothetical protein
MSDPAPSVFDEKLRKVTQLPGPRPEFVEGLWAQIAARPASVLPSVPERARRRLARPAWYALGLLVVGLVILTLVIGPQRVFAAVRELLGYIPGVGIVDQSGGIRVLAEPVSANRDGITLTVTGATLTADGTRLQYRTFGVPSSAYPLSEAVSGCYEPEYLRLPDGAKLEARGEMGPVPPDVNEAVFVLPCLAGTLPGTVPEDWELPLRFVPAPDDLAVMPVVELSPSSEPSSETAETPAAAEETGVITAVPEPSPATFTQVIETDDGYILIGEFRPEVQPGTWVQVTGVPLIHDANGKNVPYSFPLDIQRPEVNDGSGGFGFAFEFRSAGLAYPLNLSFSGVIVSPADPEATAEFEFDFGPDPQPGQQWRPDLDIQLAGHTLKLVSIATDSRNGYSFEFLTDPQVSGASVQILGHSASGGGGGGGGGLTGGRFSRSLGYERIPTGRVTILLSNLTVVSDPITWLGQWAPASPMDHAGAAPTPQPGLCLTSESLDQLPAAPPGLFRGLALVYRQLEGTDDWGEVLLDLETGGEQVVIPGGSRGDLSPDGSRLAYSAADGIRIEDIAGGEETLTEAVGGYDLHWSPDGSQIAYIGGSSIGTHVIQADGTGARQISGQSYEAVIGWAPNGAEIYVAIPFTGGAAWQVRAVNTNTPAWRDLFIIENGSAKSLSAALSPDGNWIAYRSRDHTGVYLVRTNGEEAHLLLEKVTQGISGIVWGSGEWLGVSVVDSSGGDRILALVQPGSCLAYSLPAVHGDLEGLHLK